MHTCPNCGEPVPSNSLTCPKCYAKMPPETAEYKAEYSHDQGSREKSGLIRLILTIVPAFFGFLGLGVIYNDYKARIGYEILAVGLIVYVIAVGFLVWGWFGVLIGGLFAFLYFLGFLFSCLVTLGTVRTFRFRCR